MSTPTYTDWQTTFFLSYISNGIADLAVPVNFSLAPNTTQTGDAEIILANMLSAKIGSNLSAAQSAGLIASDWKVVWGPGVYVAGADATGSFLAANAAFVACSPSENRYVLAIAATDPLSTFDWVVEDFAITPTYSYYSAMTYWSGSQSSLPKPSDGGKNIPSLTSATVNGVKNVLSLVDPNSKTTLLSYLQNDLTLGSGQTLTVTGHSLGGALSPTLALALVEKATQPVSNNPKTANPLTGLSASQVQFYATAGASPGNSTFTGLLAATLPPTTSGQVPWQSWNADIYNIYDLVPSAWTTGTLTTILGNYSLNPPYQNTTGITTFSAGLAAAITAAGAWTLANGDWGTLRTSSSGFLPGSTWAQAVAYYATIPNLNVTLTLTEAQITAYNNAVGSQNQITDTELPSLPVQIGTIQHVQAYCQAILGWPPLPPASAL